MGRNDSNMSSTQTQQIPRDPFMCPADPSIQRHHEQLLTELKTMMLDVRSNVAKMDDKIEEKLEKMSERVEHKLEQNQNKIELKLNELTTQNNDVNLRLTKMETEHATAKSWAVGGGTVGAGGGIIALITLAIDYLLKKGGP